MRRSLIRYAAVGVLATAAHYAALTLWVEWAGGRAWIGSGVGATLGAQLAFWGNRRFTFSHRGPLWPAWWRFQLTAVAGALAGMGIVAAGTAAGLHYLLAQALATLAVMLATFGLNRHWSFRPG